MDKPSNFECALEIVLVVWISFDFTISLFSNSLLILITFTHIIVVPESYHLHKNLPLPKVNNFIPNRLLLAHFTHKLDQQH